MWKKIILWFIFTLFLGMIPLIILIFSSRMNGHSISLISAMKEIFFLTIIFCSDILKTLFELDSKEIDTGKTFIQGLSFVILLLASIFYGYMQLYDKENNIMIIYGFSVFFCVFSGVMAVLTQILVKGNCK